MKRTCHYLKENAQAERPSQMIILDTETRISHREDGGQTHSLRLGAAIFLRRSRGKWLEEQFSFNDHDSFYKFLDLHIRKGSVLYLMAHNAAYDYGILNMDHYLTSRNFVIGKFVIGQMFMVHARTAEGKSIHFIDTMNWFRTSLKMLGKSFGEEKDECPDFDNVSDGDLMEYCKQDVLVLKKVVLEYLKFLDDHDLGNFKETAASQAFGAFRHRFMEPKTILVHTYQRILTLEMSSYRGGRCEAFHIGEVPREIFKLDVNSMYPHVMREERYPVKPISRKPISGLSVEEIIQGMQQGLEYVMNADIELREPCLAVKRDKLIFPIGKVMNTPLLGSETRFLHDHPEAGTILKVREAVGYECQDIFSRYVDYFYNLKLSSSGASRDLAKLFLNSLYGKFGQKDNTSIKKVEDPQEVQQFRGIFLSIGKNTFWNHAQLRSKVMLIGDDVYQIFPKEKDSPSYSSVPIISSMVTAHARTYLYELIRTAGREHVFYCDTDSLFCDRAGYDNLDAEGMISEKTLGKLKLEGIGKVSIYGAKHYTFDGHEFLKGVPKSASRDGNQFSYLNWNTKISRYEDLVPGEIALDPVMKTITGIYDKGTVTESGKVEPLILSE